MEEHSLSIAFSDSLKEETVACISDLTEVGLDAIIEDGILKDIPLLSTAIAIYKIGNNIKDRHNLKKLIMFLNEINNGIVNEEKRLKYQQKFQSNEDFRNQEIEYLLILIDRYISYDKPKMLAKLYLAYMEQQIKWFELCQCAEIIDRFLYGDYELLKTAHEIVIKNNKGTENALRLIALGLLREKGTTYDEKTEALILNIDSNNPEYSRTNLGDKLVEIIENQYI